MKKVALRIGLFGIILVIIGIMLFLVENDYEMVERSVDIKNSKGILKGTLVLPKKTSGKVGLVVFIHGDGPVEASYDGGYKPLWERLALSGYASLSWNKPGISGSSGNWLLQSMEDRAIEANEAMAWAKTLPEIDPNRIGLWGASQAGWVIPKIVQQNKHIAFSILVAPAINWVEQSKYNFRKVMEKSGATKEQMNLREMERVKVLELIERGADYEKYVKIIGTKAAVTADRWTFIMKNYQSDAAEDIGDFYSPVKLILGGRDINVDSENTKLIYEREVAPEILNVTTIPTADHSMLKPTMVTYEFMSLFTAIFFPRQLFEEQYFVEIEEFLKDEIKNIH